MKKLSTPEDIIDTLSDRERYDECNSLHCKVAARHAEEIMKSNLRVFSQKVLGNSFTNESLASVLRYAYEENLEDAGHVAEFIIREMMRTEKVISITTTSKKEVPSQFNPKTILTLYDHKTSYKFI